MISRTVLAIVVALTATQTACAARHVTAATAPPCAARAGAAAIEWVLGPAEDRASLDRWCFGVGPVIAIDTDAPDTLPELDELLVVTWNAHVGQGRLLDVVAAIRAGQFSAGRPVPHFVLLIQEALRRGAEVPQLMGSAASAGAIGGAGEDIRAAAHALGLSLIYVPSMRNGLDRPEDRGNAILSTLPLRDPVAIELPFTRQRRVAIGATVGIEEDGRPVELLLMNVHLDPLGPARSLWFFGNPRQKQMATVLEEIERRIASPHDVVVATVLGGDLNVLNGGVREAVYQDARRWATSIADEDERTTHMMGRLDYLFFRFPDEWLGATTRADSRFGSDHYPVAGSFFRTPSPLARQGRRED